MSTATVSPASPLIIRGLVTHKKHHLDEGVALWLFARFGGRTLRVAERPELYFVPQAPQPPEGRTVEEFFREGCFVIGVWGSPFDEHAGKAGEGRERRKNACAATLVAEFLGLAEDPVLKPLLQYVLQQDTKGGGRWSDLAKILHALHETLDDHAVLEATFAYLDDWYATERLFDQAVASWLVAKFAPKSETFGPLSGEEAAPDAIVERLGMQGDEALGLLLEYVRGGSQGDSEFSLREMYFSRVIAHPENPSSAASWLHQLLDAHHARQVRFFGATREAYERGAWSHQVPGPKGGVLTAVVVTGMAKEIELVARYVQYRAKHEGWKADVVLAVSRDTGHFAVLTSPDSRERGLNLRDLARTLRIQIGVALGIETTTDWKVLEGEGTLNNVYYDPEAGWILYGGPTASSVPRLPESVLEQIAQVTLPLAIRLSPEDPAAFAQDAVRLSDGSTVARAELCRSRGEEAGHCTNAQLRCPLYASGLVRCRTIRYDESRQQQTGPSDGRHHLPQTEGRSRSRGR